jgi:hypothetical protein
MMNIFRLNVVARLVSRARRAPGNWHPFIRKAWVVGVQEQSAEGFQFSGFTERQGVGFAIYALVSLPGLCENVNHPASVGA